MDDRDGVQSLLAHRKLTRAITDEVRGRMVDCLKALAPAPENRYTTARDFQEALRHWLGRSGEDGGPAAAAEPAAQSCTKSRRFMPTS